MILYDVLAICDENKVTVVYDASKREIARYDGRNSIPTELNNCEVCQISAKGNEICIYVVQ